ncbi:MAG: UDP-3-O-acyl-N-acetylglucosamine deacetylase [Rickettsiales bacterium]|jgi:UDP-3-O-[3-hydroxymyristoyl] N-acetylglucosamine deacetylase|nr:UDP-3-O-acyl-N-acetylglucosamine deacetylase [Rickettsiales bacterium]
MKTIKISGVGVHSGKKSVMEITPTKSGGIVFVRDGVRIPARFDNVGNAMLRNTTIGTAPNEVQTIEHLMAALFVSGVADCEIKIDNSETPILDGSAAELIKLLKPIAEKSRAPYLVIKKPVIARQSESMKKMPVLLRFLSKTAGFFKGRKLDGWVGLSPVRGRKLEVAARLIYKERIIGDQSFGFVFDYDDFAKSAADFAKNIARSRTFGKAGEWEWLKAHGMGRGVDETNVIALGTIGDLERLHKIGIGKGIKKSALKARGENEVVALNGLFYPDEFVRHKIIDAVGDLYTSGFRIVGKLESYKGSHAMNNIVLRKLFADPENYDIISENKRIRE